MYSTVPWAKREDLLSKPYLLPLHSHRTIYLLDPSLSARVRRRRRRRQEGERCVRFSSVQEFLFLHSSPPWGPLSYLCSAHSESQLHTERRMEHLVHPAPIRAVTLRGSRTLKRTRNFLLSSPPARRVRTHTHASHRGRALKQRSARNSRALPL